MINADELQLQSHRFFAEERLTASVLNESADAERHRRWLHNKLLHGFGISFGLEVARARGDTAVVVGLGHAIDAEGRDLVVGTQAEVQVPAISTGVFDLVCEWSNAQRETSVSSCGSTGETLRREMPLLRFVEADQGTSGVVLARAEIANCKLAKLTFDTRRALNSAPVPYVDAGHYFPQSSEWTELTASAANVVVGLRLTVNTQSAGFFGIVSYTPRVMGPRWKSSWDLVLCLDTFVIEAKADSFVMGVIVLADDVKVAAGFTPVKLADFSLRTGVAAKDIPKELGWTVAWMGVEGTQ